MRGRVATLVIGLLTVLGLTGAARSGASSAAKLAYVTGTETQQVWLAFADGSHPQRLGPGSQPIVSPDGADVAASVFPSTGNALVIYRPGSPTRGYFDATKFTADPVSWSPDSRYLAVELFDTNAGGAGLVIVDTRTNTTRTVANGTICGASFAPTLPDRLAYGRGSTRSLCFGPGLDIYTIMVGGTGRRQITHDGHSLNPVWGVTRIAYDSEKLRGPDAPLFQIWLMDPDGTHRSQLTRVFVGPLVEGLVPLQFSANGQRLLAEYEGQDTGETWTIEIASKRARHLSVNRQDVIGGGLSQDGKTVLVGFGAFGNPPSQAKVETIPFAGGPAKVLVNHAAEPTWNR